MNTKMLKNKILQLAIQGKLVEQNPNDEPASVLLEKIKAEKEQLVKEKKIKREKPLPEISEEEKSFEIPEGWEWIRLGDITLNHDSKRKPVSIKERDNLKKIYNYYGAAGAIDKVENYIFDGLYLLIGEDGGNFFVDRDVAFIVKGKFWANNHVHVLEYFNDITTEYMKIYLNSLDFKSKDLITGIAVPKLNQYNLNSIVVSLPPLEEQKRIVEKVDELFKLVDELDSNKEYLLQTIENTKNKVLQLAIQGKLVEQNPNDEPASVLLEKIKAEKEKLIKEKKIKKEKPLPEINEEEKPFEIPDNWEWVRLGKIIQLTSGQDMTTSEYNDKRNGIPYITGASNIENEKLIINRWTEVARAIAIKNDILLTCKGTVGKTIIQKEDKVHIARQIMAIRGGEFLNNNYVKYFVDSYVAHLQANAKSMIPGISRDDVLKIVFPLPPLEEQKRIADKIEKLMNYVDRLQNKINNQNLISKMVEAKAIDVENSRKLINN